MLENCLQPQAHASGQRQKGAVIGTAKRQGEGHTAVSPGHFRFPTKTDLLPRLFMGMKSARLASRAPPNLQSWRVLLMVSAPPFRRPERTWQSESMTAECCRHLAAGPCLAHARCFFQAISKSCPSETLPQIEFRCKCFAPSKRSHGWRLIKQKPVAYTLPQLATV